MFLLLFCDLSNDSISDYPIRIDGDVIPYWSTTEVSKLEKLSYLQEISRFYSKKV